jgi:hypothetical protein
MLRVLFFLMLRMLLLNVANSLTMLHAIWSNVATRLFLLFFFFSATVTHLTYTVDLTALHPSGGPRPSGRPGASNSLFKIQTSCGLLDQAVLCPHSSCRRSECISLISRLASNNLLQKISKYLRSSKRKNDRSISSRF